MAFLEVGYVTVPVRPGGLRGRIDPVGSVRRAFDGSPRSSVRAHYRVWAVESQWMSAADAASLEAELVALGEVDVSGDALTASSVIVDAIQRTEMTPAGGGALARVSFELWETAGA